MRGWSHWPAGCVESILDGSRVRRLTELPAHTAGTGGNLRETQGFCEIRRGRIVEMVDVRSMSDALAGVPLFAGLDADGLANLVRGMRVRRFRRAETVFHVGDPGDALFVVMSGSIKITLPADTGDEAIRLAGPLTQGDLAAMIGCTRQSVNKLLGLFTDDGLIRLERDRIVILDLEGLNRTAHR